MTRAAIQLTDEERTAAMAILASLPNDPDVALDTVLATINASRARQREALAARLLGVSVEEYRVRREIALAGVR
ncbi:hypothetical protein [Mycobacterium aquaticum]|uniref:Uncharacterized protein n=1 Tax=Mycobacterium aquaticum TaxID=1927124 RepID=A0A1X0A4E8_9MYCO|nr:hypothetical protein [Mycobacterium aquaticum]ORA24930.1 hypothetical protein BST13_33725 [Mycobacterium aquaticum]